VLLPLASDGAGIMLDVRGFKMTLTETSAIGMFAEEHFL
jgi:hypothetical protein